MVRGAITSGFLLAAIASFAQTRESSAGKLQGEVRKLTPAFLSQLAEELRTNHPALKAAGARVKASGAATEAVRTWEDPMARLGGMAAREEMRAEEGDLIYGIEQKLPLFGKPAAERRVARAEQSVETAQAEYEFQRLRTELAQVLFRAALADEVVTIGEQDLRWLEVMIDAVETRYRSGLTTLVEVLQLQNERTRRSAQLETDRDLVRHEQLTANRLLNRPLQSAWPHLQLPEPGPQVAFGPKLVGLALKYEPKSEVLRRRISQSRAAVERARKQRAPEVSTGVEARNYTGDGSFRQGMIVLSMSVPWFNGGKYRSQIRSEEARQEAAEFELADYQLALQEEVHLLTVKIESARRQVMLSRSEIVPRSKSALESARVGWESGQNTLRDVLEARRMLLDAQLMMARGISDQYQMLSDLVLCCGLGDLEALEMLSQPEEPAAAPAESQRPK